MVFNTGYFKGYPNGNLKGNLNCNFGIDLKGDLIKGWLFCNSIRDFKRQFK